MTKVLHNKRKPIVKEKDIQRQILVYLRFRGIFCWKNNSVGIFKQKTGQYIPLGMRGISDIIGIMPGGRLLAIEVKRPGGKLTDDQAGFMNTIVMNGGIAFMVRSLEEAKLKMKEVWKQKRLPRFILGNR